MIQFAKRPEPGKVKTRLIPALGADGALEAHIRLTCTVLENLVESGYPVELWWDSAADDSPLEQDGRISALLASYPIMERMQSSGDLGQRMLGALNDGLRRADKVIIVGSDCPSVDPQYVGDAVAQLEHSDVVLGPAEDGGYVLVGVRRTQEGMFRAVEWGTDGALDQSRVRFEAVGLLVGFLESRWDVDEVEDWERYLSRLELPFQ